MFKKFVSGIIVISMIFCLFACSNTDVHSSPLKESAFISSGVDKKTTFTYDEYEDYVIVTGINSAPDDIEIPETLVNKEVKAIGKNAFSDMGWVKTIKIPDTVLEIRENAFYGCVSLESVTLSENLHTLGSSAFCGSNSLKTVRLPLTLKIIGGYAFADCTKLKNVVIPDGASSIGGGAFMGTEWLESQEDEFVIAGDNVLIHYNGEKEKLTIPDGIKEISAFSDNLYVKEITLPESAERIGEYAFINSSLVSISLTENVKSVGKSAFDGCLNFEEITFNEAIEEIGSYAFSGCQLIEEMTIPESVKKVGDGSFTRCDGLKKLTFISEKTEIGEDICDSCDKLEKILCPKNSPVIDYAKDAGFSLDII